MVFLLMLLFFNGILLKPKCDEDSTSANWGLHSDAHCAYLGNIRSSTHRMHRWNPRSHELVSHAVMPAEQRNTITGIWMNNKNSSALQSCSTKLKLCTLCQISLKIVHRSVHIPCFLRLLVQSAHVYSLILKEGTVCTVFIVYIVCIVYTVYAVCSTMHSMH